MNEQPSRAASALVDTKKQENVNTRLLSGTSADMQTNDSSGLGRR
jgi:hypothetical protein